MRSSSSSSSSSLSPSSSSPSSQSTLFFYHETFSEYALDFSLGIAFTIIGILVYCRRRQAVKAATMLRKKYPRMYHPLKVALLYSEKLYLLLILTCFFRAIWFLIPSSLFEPTYYPTPVWAFHSLYYYTNLNNNNDNKNDDDVNINDPKAEEEHLVLSSKYSWLGILFSEILSSCGSLFLFNCFVLTTVRFSNMFKSSISGGTYGGYKFGNVMTSVPSSSTHHLSSNGKLMDQNSHQRGDKLRPMEEGILPSSSSFLLKDQVKKENKDDNNNNNNSNYNKERTRIIKSSKDQNIMRDGISRSSWAQNYHTSDNDWIKSHERLSQTIRSNNSRDKGEADSTQLKENRVTEKLGERNLIQIINEDNNQNFINKRKNIQDDENGVEEDEEEESSILSLPDEYSHNEPYLNQKERLQERDDNHYYDIKQDQISSPSSSTTLSPLTAQHLHLHNLKMQQQQEQEQGKGQNRFTTQDFNRQNSQDSTICSGANSDNSVLGFRIGYQNPSNSGDLNENTRLFNNNKKNNNNETTINPSKIAVKTGRGGYLVNQNDRLTKVQPPIAENTSQQYYYQSSNKDHLQLPNFMANNKKEYSAKWLQWFGCHNSNENSIAPSFNYIMLFLVLGSCLNILLFVLVRYNSDVMVLLDNLLFSFFSLVCGYQMSVHHNWYVKILNSWANIERTDQNNLNMAVQRPIQKVVAFKRILNSFFISRAILELIMFLFFLYMWVSERMNYENSAVIASSSTKTEQIDKIHEDATSGNLFFGRILILPNGLKINFLPIWEVYVFLKHFAEIILISLIYYVLRPDAQQDKGQNKKKKEGNNTTRKSKTRNSTSSSLLQETIQRTAEDQGKETKKGYNRNVLKFDNQGSSVTHSNEYTPLTWNQKDKPHNIYNYSALNNKDEEPSGMIEDGLFRGKMMTTYTSSNSQKSIDHKNYSNISNPSTKNLRLKPLNDNQPVVIVQGDRIQQGTHLPFTASKISTASSSSQLPTYSYGGIPPNRQSIPNYNYLAGKNMVSSKSSNKQQYKPNTVVPSTSLRNSQKEKDRISSSLGTFNQTNSRPSSTSSASVGSGSSTDRRKILYDTVDITPQFREGKGVESGIRTMTTSRRSSLDTSLPSTPNTSTSSPSNMKNPINSSHSSIRNTSLPMLNNQPFHISTKSITNSNDALSTDKNRSGKNYQHNDISHDTTATYVKLVTQDANIKQLESEVGFNRDGRVGRNSEPESRSKSIQNITAGSKMNLTPTLMTRGDIGNISGVPSNLDGGHGQTTLNSHPIAPITSTAANKVNEQGIQQQTNSQDSIQQQLLNAMNTLQLAQLQQMQQQQQQQQLALSKRPESAGSISKKKKKKKREKEKEKKSDR